MGMELILNLQRELWLVESVSAFKNKRAKIDGF